MQKTMGSEFALRNENSIHQQNACKWEKLSGNAFEICVCVKCHASQVFQLRCQCSNLSCCSVVWHSSVILQAWIEKHQIIFQNISEMWKQSWFCIGFWANQPKIHCMQPLVMLPRQHGESLHLDLPKSKSRWSFDIGEFKDEWISCAQFYCWCCAAFKILKLSTSFDLKLLES